MVITVVIPVFNESNSLEPLALQLSDVSDRLKKDRLLVLLVDDGSSDDTRSVVGSLIDRGMDLSYLKLSQNCGHQAALNAGLRRAIGDAVITMDGDLQHPAKEILRMVDMFKSGADVVQMVRDKAPFTLKGVLSSLFYKVFSNVSESRLVSNGADFRLMSRRVVDELLKNSGKEPGSSGDSSNFRV